MTERKLLLENDKFIIAEALMEIHSVDDILKVIHKVEGTTVFTNPYARTTFLKLVKLKRKMLESRSR